MDEFPEKVQTTFVPPSLISELFGADFLYLCIDLLNLQRHILDWKWRFPPPFWNFAQNLSQREPNLLPKFKTKMSI